MGGLIVEGSKTALPNPNLDLYEKLDLAGIPVVFIHGSYGALPGAVCVSDDNFGGGYQLARHLIARGHTKIAGIFKSDDIQGHQRYLGYLTAMRDAGLPYRTTGSCGTPRRSAATCWTMATTTC